MTRLCCLLLLLAAPRLRAGDQYWLTGVYAPVGAGAQTPELLPWYLYTHFSHFSAHPTSDCSIDASLLAHQIPAFVQAARATGRKSLVTILDGAPGDFLRCTTPANLPVFASNIHAFVANHGYDGVDLDWEQVPSQSQAFIAQYRALLSRLRQLMPASILTMDAYWRTPGSALERVAASASADGSLDRVNVMCYDMDGPWKGYVWHVSALWQAGDASVDACDAQVRSFVDAGVPPARINAGFPFYGRVYRNVPAPRAPLSPSVRRQNIFYRDLVSNPARWLDGQKYYDPVHGANYILAPALSEFISYAGDEMIDELATWVRSQNLGGIMTFTTGYEFIPDEFGFARYPLSKRLSHGLFGSLPEDALAEPFAESPLARINKKKRAPGPAGPGALSFRGKGE